MVFSLADAKKIAEQLKVGFSEFRPEDFLLGINHELEHEDVTGGDLEKTARIALAHLKEDAQYYQKLSSMEEKKNAKGWAKVYKAKIIEQGVCQYEDETILILNDALFKMTETFKGRPVIFKNFEHDKVTPENSQEKAVGYVTRCYYEELSGDFWVDFVVFDDEANEAIRISPFVSCSYLPIEFGKGGTWHTVEYKREVLNGEYTHLAIVARPRYEDAKIYENSKEKKEKDPMFKLFQKKEVEKELQNAVVEIEGKDKKMTEVPLSDLVKVYQNSKSNSADEKEKLNADDEIDVDGEKVKVSELVNCYKKAKNNADEETEEEKKKREEEEKAAAEKKNTEEEEKKEEEEKEKENGKQFFNSVSTAIEKTKSGQAIQVGTYWSDAKGFEEGLKEFSK